MALSPLCRESSRPLCDRPKNRQQENGPSDSSPTKYRAIARSPQKSCAHRSARRVYSSNSQCDRQRGFFALSKTFFRRNTDVFQGKMALTEREKARCPGVLGVGRIHPRLFREIDSCAPSLTAPTRHLVVSVIFRMIYCCGLRPVEARRLRREDVSLCDGVVKILESKGHKDRIVVLSESMLALCVTYDQRAETIYPDRKYFFQSPSARGDGMYSVEWMIPTFRRFLHSAGIFGYAGITPRTYDLRHTFATHRLYQWIKEGKDVNACLAYLSEYMGHANLSDTAYYIHLLPTLYTDLPELHLDTLQTEVNS